MSEQMIALLVHLEVAALILAIATLICTRSRDRQVKGASRDRISDMTGFRRRIASFNNRFSGMNQFRRLAATICFSASGVLAIRGVLLYFVDDERRRTMSDAGMVGYLFVVLLVLLIGWPRYRELPRKKRRDR